MPFDLSLDVSTLQAALARWVTEQSRQGVFVTDRELRIVFWSRWMEIHTGRLAAEALGRPLFELYPEALDRGVQEYYELALQGRVTVLSHVLHRYVLRMPPTNADLGFAEMPQSGHVGPLSHGTDTLGTVTVVEDVSPQLAGEIELRKQIAAQRQARSTAEQALRAKDEFLSTLSHEMRTPLNAVLGWSRILLGREEVDRPLLERALSVIERNASAQAKMIDDMLDMARIVAGKLRLETQPVDLLGVVLAAVDVVMPSANAKRITVRTQLDPKTPRVLGDPDRLQQIVWNLLSNALKFTDAGGAIEVRLEQEPGVARIVVRDTGRGISPAFLPLVFDRFRQDDTSSARRHGGLGLGLSLVRDLVELHGGSVRAASDGDAMGSTFTIALPTIMSPDARGRYVDREPSAEPLASLDGVRVLVVEDEADSREVMVAALRQRGAMVTAVSSSRDAIAAVRSATADAPPPHVIVSDIGMPREDGYALIRQIRNLAEAWLARIPAIAVTGYATPDDVARALSSGFQMHVSKPMDPAALIASIARLAGRPGHPGTVEGAKDVASGD